ncbi:caspase-8-like [Branchiostoma floridae x Branchiostoma japonicum]
MDGWMDTIDELKLRIDRSISIGKKKYLIFKFTFHIGRLQEVFESLGFNVVTFSDLDHAKMVATMKNQGKADHSNYNCFVCCIMSHGTTGKVYSSDDVGIDICELMKPVNAKKCKSLKGKPKLFFIQACQGFKTQGRDGFDHGEHDAKPVIICHEADFFLGLATVPGYVALRDPAKGAPYVYHLAKLLKDLSPTHDLFTIMAMVCDKMNNIHYDKCGWISSNHSTLRKKVVFN